MLTTQSPIVLPRIHSHSLYSELPPNSRRAANLPFFAPRTHLASSSTFSAPNISGAPPPSPRRNAIRRNAISFQPSHVASESPSMHQSSSASPPAPQLASPRPRPAVLVNSGYTAEPRPLSTSPPLVISLAPACVPRSQREYQAKMVANMLLNRAGRARPMRCARRGSFVRAGYQPSRLSVSVLAGDVDDEEATTFEEDEDLARA